MKELYLTRSQAKSLGEDLVEYAEKLDSADRQMFEGFKIRFGDLFAKEVQPGESFELHPLPSWCEIEDD